MIKLACREFLFLVLRPPAPPQFRLREPSLPVFLLTGLFAISCFLGSTFREVFWRCLIVFSQSFRTIFGTKFRGKISLTPFQKGLTLFLTLLKGQMNYPAPCLPPLPSLRPLAVKRHKPASQAATQTLLHETVQARRQGCPPPGPSKGLIGGLGPFKKGLRVFFLENSFG